MGRKNTVTLPAGMGDFETGCHTAHGNEIALYVQTTRELYMRREQILADTLAGKKKWDGLSEFNVLLRLDRPGRQLFAEAVSWYNREIWKNKTSLDVGELERQDFVAWLAREFDGFVIEDEIDRKSVV